MPVYLGDILPVDLLTKHLEDGVIRKQVHPEYPELQILNYSEKAQFDRITSSVGAPSSYPQMPPRQRSQAGS